VLPAEIRGLFSRQKPSKIQFSDGLLVKGIVNERICWQILPVYFDKIGGILLIGTR
jgi:hypothetical protein